MAGLVPTFQIAQRRTGKEWYWTCLNVLAMSGIWTKTNVRCGFE